MESGIFIHLRMPQRYLASGDTYACRYNEIIKIILHKVKIVDDTLMYDSSIEGASYHTLDIIFHCAKNRIILNRDKSQFCQDVLQFGALHIMISGVTPFWVHAGGDTKLPSPKDNHRCQVMVWAGQTGRLGVLIGSSHAALLWSRQTGLLFHFGPKPWGFISTFQMSFTRSTSKGRHNIWQNLVTCFAPNWTKERMGFLLLQKNCSCTICLIFAGSRFRTYVERRCTPIESKAAVIVWLLEKWHTFFMSCPSIIVVTDHEPIKGLFDNRGPSKIQNPWLFRRKEKSLRYWFTIQHCQERGTQALMPFLATQWFCCKPSSMYFLPNSLSQTF